MGISKTLPFETQWLNVVDNLQTYGASDYLTEALNYGIHKAPFEINNSSY